MPDGGVVVTVIDATESVQAAEALQRANESLERRVTERTAELTRLNEELAVAKAEADAANLVEDAFIAAASHDILQPLNAARLFTSSLVERMRRPKDGDLVRNVDSSLEAVEEILSALLDISRLDAGAMKPDVAPFRIDDMLQALALEFAPAAAQEGAELQGCPAGSPSRLDRKLLRRVLQNLVSNAIKYTREGRVLMGCRRHGRNCAIEVHDTGPGIPPDKRDVIFQEFQRLHGDGDGTRAWGSGCRSSSASPACWTRPVMCARRPSAAAASPSTCRWPRWAMPRLPAARPQALQPPGLPRGCHACWSSTTSRPSSTAWNCCSPAGASSFTGRAARPRRSRPCKPPAASST